MHETNVVHPTTSSLFFTSRPASQQSPRAPAQREHEHTGRPVDGWRHVFKGYYKLQPLARLGVESPWKARRMARPGRLATCGSRTVRDGIYFSGEKSVGLTNIDSTLITARPPTSEAWAAALNSGSARNPFQESRADSRLSCARTYTNAFCRSLGSSSLPSAAVYKRISKMRSLAWPWTLGVRS